MGMDRKIEKKKGIRPKHIVIGVIVVVVGGITFMSVFGSKLSTYKVERDRITISAVENGVFNDYINLNGTVEPISDIYINALESGTVEKRFVENGTMLTKGDAILELSNPNLLLEIQNATAEFARQQNDYSRQLAEIHKSKIQQIQNSMTAELDVKRAKREYEQKEAMYNDGMGTREEYIRAKENYEIQFSKYNFLVESQKQDSITRITQISQLEETLNINRLNYNEKKKKANDLIIRAPVSGQLGDFTAELGQRIGAGSSVGKVSVLTDFKISASVDEHYIDRVRENLEGKIERNDEQFALHIHRVYPAVTGGQFKVDLVFDSNKPENIRTGQTYYVKLQLGMANQAIMVSRGSFFQSTGGQWIFVLDPSGNFAVKRNIRIGRQNPQYYEVVEGLQQGEQVITSGYETFGDAEKIVFK